MATEPLKFARGVADSGDSAIWQLREYKGAQYVDGRLHDASLRPSPKGITVRLSELRALIAWLTDVADELDAPEPRRRRKLRDLPAASVRDVRLPPEQEDRLF